MFEGAYYEIMHGSPQTGFEVSELSIAELTDVCACDTFGESTELGAFQELDKLMRHILFIGM